MSDWELLSHDPATGVKKYIAADQHEDDAVMVKTEFDDAGTRRLIDENKAAQNESFDRRSDMWHAASIPSSVMYEWLTKFGVDAWNPDHSDAVKKLLNSDDYRWCKVKHIIL
jgi:hypothetical protein